MKKVLMAALIGALLASVTGCLPMTSTPTIVGTPASAVPASSTPAQK
ncbi:MAG: hypothetical protein ACAI44_36840 [Candidatus Sericytochromatia bacterium]